MSDIAWTEPPGDDWHLWLNPFDQSPAQAIRSGRTLEIWRAEWGNETKVATRQTMHPAMNVTGLWWRVL